MLLLLSRFSRVRLCATPETAAHQAPPSLGFSRHPGGSDGKETACNVGDLGSIPGLGRSPGGGHGNPLQDSRLENPHGQRSLAGYSAYGHKESDMTKEIGRAHV